MEHPLERDNFKSKAGQKFSANGSDYILEGKIGDGAVGVVRRAKKLDTNRTVAVKFLAPDPKYISVESFDNVARRFRREGIRGSKLNHECLVEILAYEDNDNGDSFDGKGPKNPFIVMEYLSGGTLEELIRNLSRMKPPLPYVNVRSLRIAFGIASALRHIHDRGITHRDVKPANVFLSSTDITEVPERVVLGDFGIVKWGDFLASVTSGTLTSSREFGLGTLKYKAPEQEIKPKDVTVRADMFSTGIVLYELLTAQILPSIHHVYQVVRARMSRGSISSKLHDLGVYIGPEHEDLFELILDMFLPSPKGRPSSTRTAGRLEWWFERYEELEAEM